MPKVIRIDQLAAELGKWSKDHMAAIKKGTLSGVAKSIPELVKASPVDTGLYAQSWDFTETESSVILGNYAPHAPIIEYGARPFRPPIGPLLAWAKRVLQDPSQPPKYSPQVWALATGTQKKIERVGIAPRKVMENAIPMIVENIKQEWEKSIG